MIDVRKVIDRVLKQGPDRVVIAATGEATSAERAERDYNIKPDVFFVRDDGWTLGAPEQFAKVAYALWEDKWVASVRLEDYQQRRP